MDISIKIEGLNQYYGRKQALKDVNLYIKTGMFRTAWKEWGRKDDPYEGPGHAS